MVQQTNLNAEVCVIGRCSFDTGIGTLTYAFCEALARHMPVCLIPTDGPASVGEEILLPNGRKIPLWAGQPIKVSLYVDVLWNGAYDQKVLLTPSEGLRLAVLVFDSDLLPPEWVRILNERFDGALCTSPHLVEIARNSGVDVPLAVLPPPLDLEPLLRRPFKRPGRSIVVGSIAAFHPRKGTQTLIEAFAAVSARNPGRMELRLHSNLAFGAVIDELRADMSRLGLANVTLSTESLSPEEKARLCDSFDVFANFSKGEGYSIGAREALALGKVLALSAVGGHSDLADCPGVFLAEATQRRPARYIEIDNRIFGEQREVQLGEAVATLQAAVDYAAGDEAPTTVHDRRRLAARHAFSKASLSVATLIDPGLVAARHDPPKPPHFSCPPAFTRIAAERLQSTGGLTHVRKRVVPVHDGGFFSLFNTFFSHLVWDLRDPRCQWVLPDWDVRRFMERSRENPPLSFCYGRPNDGNVWTAFFEPLFGLSEEDMNNETVLYEHASLPDFAFNESREPLLTYKHAYRLYNTPWFYNFRRQYNKVYRDHIYIKSDLNKEIVSFSRAETDGYHVLGAHVRHPSHAVEQPSAAIAHTEAYIDALKRQISEKGLGKRGARQWRIFLATDQQSVVERFSEEFGDHLCYFSNVDRTDPHDDARYLASSRLQSPQMGHQIQHLKASSPATWSSELGKQIIRDAVLLSRCASVLHVVSNVSTAVSFMNPDCELVFCHPSHGTVTSRR
ncbi:glycosyltransferase [Brevundimonas sp. AAP58]|uniref:glycosyltransferase n=1 Tax=Brevundimonas sp. AAP58 TaxID=1523422 RepID=UPI000A420FB0|nr:glycosyltransferase [Brevundimonas sp. AAP58]